MASIHQQLEQSPLQSETAPDLLRAVAGGSQSSLGPLHALYLRADGLLVERRPGGDEYTRICPRWNSGHRKASLTVSDPVDLLGWECPLCLEDRNTVEATERFDAVEARLVIGRR